MMLARITYLVKEIQRDWSLLSSSSPRVNFIYIFFEMFFMFIKCLCICSCLFSHLKWIHIVKNRQDCLPHPIFAFHDLYKFIQTPC